MPQTKDEQQEIAFRNAAAFLTDRYQCNPADVREIGRGVWSVAYAFASQGRDLVARFGAHRYDFEKDRVAAKYAAPELPVPALLEITEASGGEFCAITERVYGERIEELHGNEMRATLPSLLRTLDALRRADVSHTSGFGMWDETGRGVHATWCDALVAVGDDRAHHRTHGWREKLSASKEREQPFNEALDYLRTVAPTMPAERHLIHNDPLAGNIFVKNGRVSGVIDWGCSMYGDFVYDLAHFVFWRNWYTSWRDIDFASEGWRHYEGIGLRVPRFGERLACYQVQIGLDSCAFSAFRERWDEFDPVMRWVQQLVATSR
jgi:aminoglycoside phosphotransferase (APT) family kinase protein